MKDQSLFAVKNEVIRVSQALASVAKCDPRAAHGGLPALGAAY